MNFNLGFETSLAAEFVAGLSVTMRSEMSRSTVEIPVRATGLFVVEIPNDINFQSIPFIVGLRATFFNLPQLAAEAAVRLPLGEFPNGMRIRQSDPNYVEAVLDHHQEWFRSSIMDQCTVFCPGTGESRSGRNVCIECKGTRGTVRICC
jgi:hypothetical protein